MVKTVYQTRLSNILDRLCLHNDINLEWTILKNIILQAIEEALGKRNKGYKRKGLRIWNKDISQMIVDKKKACIKFPYIILHRIEWTIWKRV
jgi:hypothetical protein